AGAPLFGQPDDLLNLVEIVLHQDGIELDVRAASDHPRHDRADPLPQSWQPPVRVLPLVRPVERDVDLIDAGCHQRLGASFGQEPAIRDDADVAIAWQALDAGGDGKYVRSHEGLAPADGDAERIERAPHVQKALGVELLAAWFPPMI